MFFLKSYVVFELFGKFFQMCRKCCPRKVNYSLLCISMVTKIMRNSTSLIKSGPQAIRRP